MFKTFLKTNSLTDYPFSNDIFPAVTNRPFWDAFPKAAVLSAAEAALDYQWEPIKATDFMEFKKSGNRRIMEDIHFARRCALTALALGECCENEGRFLPQLLNGIFVVCEESYWGVSAHWHGEVGNIPSPAEPYIDLFAGETAEHLTMIYHLLYEPLHDFCPEILNRIEYELDRRIKTPYLAHTDFWWMGYDRGINNWNPWILSNVLTTFLLTERDSSRLRCAVTKIMTELQFYYDRIPEDGGCDEGPGYWVHAGASLFESLYLLKLTSQGSINFFGDEKVKRMAAYLQKVHITGALFANFADAHATPLYANIPLLYGFARETKQPALMNLAAAIAQQSVNYYTGFSYTSRRTTIRRSILTAEFDREMMAYAVSAPLHGTLEYLPDLQVATLRRGAFLVCAKGGHNAENHNHNDVGQFVFYDNGAPVLIDPGIGVYTKFTFVPYRYHHIQWVHSCHHNLPMVNDQRQEYGKNYAASAFSANENGIDVSFAQAYPAASGLLSLNRSLTLTDYAMTLKDRFSFMEASSCKVTEMLITALPVCMEENAVVLDGRYRITANTGIWTQETLPFDGDASLRADWGVEELIRLQLTVEHADSITITIEKI